MGELEERGQIFSPHRKGTDKRMMSSRSGADKSVLFSCSHMIYHIYFLFIKTHLSFHFQNLMDFHYSKTKIEFFSLTCKEKIVQNIEIYWNLMLFNTVATCKSVFSSDIFCVLRFLMVERI